MNITIVTDAWHPQVNGVVHTLTHTGRELTALGHAVSYLAPAGFPNIPCPTYPSIRLAVLPGRSLAAKLADQRPDAIHIATEGPLGIAARRWCLRHGLPFTTSWHTQFPEYLRLRAPVPTAWTYAWLRRFHAPAAATLVPTASIRDQLAARGFEHLQVWSRGVDTQLFRPRGKDALGDLPRPISMVMGRVAVEKNIEAFLELDIPGTRVVVGDGPDLERLRLRYPDVLFTGQKRGDELAAHVSAADVFVFPSRTDTFGLVMLEAMACGVPVAAFPVAGPRDVVLDGVTGALDEDLGAAVERALRINPQHCIDYAARHSWQGCAEAFLRHVQPLPAGRHAIPA